MMEITPELIAKVIKEWEADYIAHMKTYGLPNTMRTHVNDLVNKFCEVLGIDRDEFWKEE